MIYGKLNANKDGEGTIEMVDDFNYLSPIDRSDILKDWKNEIERAYQLSCVELISSMRPS